MLRIDVYEDGIEAEASAQIYRNQGRTVHVIQGADGVNIADFRNSPSGPLNNQATTDDVWLVVVN